MTNMQRILHFIPPKELESDELPSLDEQPATKQYLEHAYMLLNIQQIEMQSLGSEENAYVNITEEDGLEKQDPTLDTISYNAEILLSQEDVTLGKQLACGRFAKIFLGEYHACKCALKEVECTRKLRKYVNEGQLFKRVSNHPYICGFFGCAEIENKRYLVLDLYQDGSILDMVRTRHFNENEKLTMCYQIASGLLHLRKSYVIHCDLAARNCLIDCSGRLRTAITDFGLSCSSPCAIKIKTFAPRWASPTLVKTRIPSFESDIWAFGVTCWEIFTNGSVPYSNYQNTEVLESLLVDENNFKLKLDDSWAITSLLEELFLRDIWVEECVNWLRELNEDTYVRNSSSKL